MLAILGQLQGFDLGKLGPASPVAWHLIGESERLAFADRAAYGADSDFTPVPVAGLVAAKYLKARGALIHADSTLTTAAPGVPAGAAPRTMAPGGEVPSTTHFAAVDAAGNVASLTSTVEGGFGSSLVAGGMVLNNELTDFSFVYDAKGRVVLAIGAAGGMTIPAQVAKAIIGVLDFKLSVGDAIALPLVYASDDLLVLEKGPQGAPLIAMEAALQKLGHRTAQYALPLKANGIERVEGGWRGGVDPRSEGVSSGY